MDAKHYNGDYDRDHPSVPDHCDDCGDDLFPEERANGRCRRCEADYYANCGDDEAYERFQDRGEPA